jgi:hypothetical protein
MIQFSWHPDKPTIEEKHNNDDDDDDDYGALAMDDAMVQKVWLTSPSQPIFYHKFKFLF